MAEKTESHVVKKKKAEKQRRVCVSSNIQLSPLILAEKVNGFTQKR